MGLGSDLIRFGKGGVCLERWLECNVYTSWFICVRIMKLWCNRPFHIKIVSHTGRCFRDIPGQSVRFGWEAMQTSNGIHKVKKKDGEILDWWVVGECGLRLPFPVPLDIAKDSNSPLLVFSYGWENPLFIFPSNPRTIASHHIIWPTP